MGTLGNTAWAEDGAAVTTEPLEALKGVGYAGDAIPTSANFNWQLQQIGRAGVPRFDTPEDLIQTVLAGSADRQDIGIVNPTTFAASNPVYSEEWTVNGDANQLDLISDGEYLWYTGNGGGATLRKLSRVDGSTLLTGPFDITPAAFDIVGGKVACAGGNVYVCNGGINVKLWALGRDDITEVYSVLTGSAGTLNAMATDGEYVALALQNSVFLYRDTGAALVLVGTHNHGASVLDVAMNGQYIAYGGVSGIGGASAGKEAVLLDYTPAVFTTYGRVANQQVDKLDFDGDRLVVYGPDDGTGDEGGLIPGIGETSFQWNDATGRNDAVFMDSHGRGRILVAGVDGTITVFDDGRAWSSGNTDRPWARHVILWDGGVATPVRSIAWDHDALFVMGDVDTGGDRVKRYLFNTQPRQYKNQDPTYPYRSVHSLIQPVR